MPSRPYRPFFLLAALDAVLGAVVWLPWASLDRLTGIDPGAWHRDALLFGTIPAILAGFLLTALPRWTGQPPSAPGSIAGLVGLWLCTRAASLVSTAVGLALSAAFVLTVASVAAARIIAAHDRRNLKVLGLLLAFCGSILLTAAGFVPMSYRLAVACLLGLVMVIGGRVTPALTASLLAAQGTHVATSRSPAVEFLAAATGAAALLSWIVAPHHPASGLLSAGAAVAHAVRLMRWQGWRCIGSAAVTPLHVGYGWIPVGFVLRVLNVLEPALVSQAAALHAWTIGAIGTMSIAIMASMIRKNSGRPFARSSATTAAAVTITACAVMRVAAELSPAGRTALTGLSAICWIAAFVLFLWAFRDVLLRRAAPPPARR
jgi:uncharacterized protein involved in response to NO